MRIRCLWLSRSGSKLRAITRGASGLASLPLLHSMANLLYWLSHPVWYGRRQLIRQTTSLLAEDAAVVLCAASDFLRSWCSRAISHSIWYPAQGAIVDSPHSAPPPRLPPHSTCQPLQALAVTTRRDAGRRRLSERCSDAVNCARARDPNIWHIVSGYSDEQRGVSHQSTQQTI